MRLSGTIIRGTLIQGLNRHHKRKTQLGNRAHSANRLAVLCSHGEPRQAVFLRSKGEEGLLDGDPGEEEATNDDNFVVTLHPDTIEHPHPSCGAQILSRSQRGQIHIRPMAQLCGTDHPRPLQTRRAISGSLKTSLPRPPAAHRNSASLEGSGPTLGK